MHSASEDEENGDDGDTADDEDEPDDDELSAAFEFGGIKRPESKTYDKLVRFTLS